MAFRLLQPDFTAKNVLDVTPSLLQSHGIKGVMLDIDNTLTEEGSMAVSNEVDLWLRLLRQSGLRMVLVSNSGEDRVRPFADAIDLPYVFNAGKPRRRCLSAALDALGVAKQESVMIGDQVFTDVLFSNRCGIRSILISPLGEDSHRGAAVKRLFERPVRRRAGEK